MSDRTLKVPKGSEVGLEIKNDQPSTPPRAQAQVRGPLDVPPQDELYVFRKKGITFYDLGTRKVGDNYVDQIPRHFTPPPTLNELYDWYHDTLLGDGSDFLVGGACMKIPFAAQFLYLDVEFIPMNGDETYDAHPDFLYVNPIGQPDLRPPVVAPLGSNFTETNWKSAGLVFGPPSDSGDWGLALQTMFYYNAFFTVNPYDLEQVYFTVTAEPDPNADSVNFVLRGNERIFLTPIRTLVSTGTTPNHHFYWRRLPVIPDFAPQADAMDIFNSFVEFFPFIRARYRAKPGASLFDAMESYYNGDYAAFGGTASLIAALPPSAFFLEEELNAAMFTSQRTVDPRSFLVAVIAQGSDIFYVWRNYTAGFFGFEFDAGGWPHVFRWSQINHP